jgi:hypothetical protein
MTGATLLALLAAPAHAAEPAELFVSGPPSDPASLQADSQECAYCHIVNGTAGRALYEGDISAYEEPSDHAHTAKSTPCLSCHVRHDEQGMLGPVADKLLRVRAYQPEIVDGLAGGDAAAITNGTARAAGWDPREIQLTAFCSSCHPAYSNGPGQDVAVEERGEDGSVVVTYRRHHPLTPLDDALHFETTMYGTQKIAARPTTGCTSCHGAGTGAVAGDFPHSTPGSVQFLVSGDDAEAPAEAAVSARLDGVCMRCHQWKDAEGYLRGVGIDF